VTQGCKFLLQAVIHSILPNNISVKATGVDSSQKACLHHQLLYIEHAELQ
jgi:hypothetical protein